jgi:hypothetical protein
MRHNTRKERKDEKVKETRDWDVEKLISRCVVSNASSVGRRRLAAEVRALMSKKGLSIPLVNVALSPSKSDLLIQQGVL